ncbi:MAG: FeS-binding protein [Synergistetes bacterium]|nr:FeS-binding protein [Synergistota bacterium]MCX8127336.1 FeS-binding protein [Synergistota bacterium]MDW8192200.1 FeS-binding protein [Synergistota bacterium]
MVKFIRIVGVLLYLVMMILGIFYPLIGVVVLGYLVTVVILGRRKKWCSLNCPRGSFYDFIISKLSLKRPLSKFLRNNFTWKLFLILLVLLMVVQFYIVRPFDYDGVEMFEKLGLIFYRACFVSSAIGIPLSIYYNHRAWCAVCPVGNLLRK